MIKEADACSNKLMVSYDSYSSSSNHSSPISRLASSSYYDDQVNLPTIQSNYSHYFYSNSYVDYNSCFPNYQCNDNSIYN